MRIISFQIVFFMIFIGVSLASESYEDRSIVAEYYVMQDIAQSKTLRAREKLQKLEKYLDTDKTQVSIKFWLRFNLNQKSNFGGRGDSPHNMCYSDKGFFVKGLEKS
jgi:polyphosphate kinase 2 (PPK2 family)